MFTIEEREGKGMAMIATMDLLPGTELFSEKEGLLYIPKSAGGSSGELGYEMGFHAYSEFKKLPVEKPKRFLELYCPTSGTFPDLIRELTRNSNRRESDAEEWKPLSAEQHELVTRVACTFTCNSFPTEDGGRAAFEIASRINHSCFPNCLVNFPERRCYAMILRPIKAGEEIVIEYNRQFRFKGTAERRQQYQNTRDFTCHCPRCDAPVDEMRQFNCFDATCPGRYYACQPVSDTPLTTKCSTYSGVTASPFRLLPCTTCQRPAPEDYQKMMLAAEERALLMFSKLQTAFDSGYPNDYNSCKLLMKLSDTLLAALPWHGLSIAVRDFRYDWFHKTCDRSMRDGSMSYADLLHTEKEAMQGQNQFNDMKYVYPCETLARSIFVAAHIVLVGNNAQSRQEARELTLRGMRVHKILLGRNMNALQAGGELEDLLCDTTTSAHVGHTERCAWCEEIFAHAAMKLSLCGRCRRVAYCSEQCQKAHWRGHKKFCKKA